MADDPWRPRLSEGLKVQVIDGEAVVLDRANERIHQLNASGTLILVNCDGTRTEEDIVAMLVGRYEVADAAARFDTSELLARMRALEVLV